MPGTATAVERIFREEYGRLIASLVRCFGDIDVAQEGAGEALVAAREKWPDGGVPRDPEPGSRRPPAAGRPRPGRSVRGAFFVPETTMAQPITRTKKKIAAANIRCSPVRGSGSPGSCTSCCLAINRPALAAINAVHTDASAAATDWSQVVTL